MKFVCNFKHKKSSIRLKVGGRGRETEEEGVGIGPMGR